MFHYFLTIVLSFFPHNEISIGYIVVLVVGSESSQNWVRGDSGLGPKSTKGPSCLGPELSGYHPISPLCEPSAQMSLNVVCAQARRTESSTLQFTENQFEQRALVQILQLFKTCFCTEHFLNGNLHCAINTFDNTF